MTRLSRLAPALGALLASASAPGQVVAIPESLRVTVEQGQEAGASLTLLDMSGSERPYCLDFDRPLQRTTGEATGDCGPAGQLLFSVVDEDVGHPFWSPYGLTMTPDGRLFAADPDGLRRTYELDASLNLQRFFEHPRVAELDPFPETVGVTYNEDTGTLWWTNAEITGTTIHRVLLLEGGLDGVATGRRIQLPLAPNGYPAGASYDPAEKRYYFVDLANRRLWAVDTLGTAVAGYPRIVEGHTEWTLRGVDAHGGLIGGPEGVRFDVLVGPPGSGGWDRVIVTDPLGTNHLAVTMVPSFGLGFQSAEGVPVRSRLDPNGIIYMAFAGIHPKTQQVVQGIAAVRPAPLSPTWLSLPSWSGEIPAGGTSQITLTFRAAQRAPGEYRSTLAVEDTTGAVLASVPLTLVVTPETPAEPGPDRSGASLRVSPNPARGAATATLALTAPAHARVTAHDVLGREVGVLLVGPLPAGATRLALPALPAGVYIVRAVTAGWAASERFVVSREG